MIDFTTLQKLQKNVWDLGKLIVAKGFKKLPKSYLVTLPSSSSTYYYFIIFHFRWSEPQVKMTNPNVVAIEFCYRHDTMIPK